MINPSRGDEAEKLDKMASQTPMVRQRNAPAEPIRKPRHIGNLTGIRALAALWVLVYHFQESPIVEHVNLGPVAAYGYLGVDVFFVLSGFILSWNYASSGRELLQRTAFRSFVVKRFARIYPLHLATFLVSVAMWSVARITNYRFTNDIEYGLWSGLMNVLNLHAWGLTDQLSWNGPSWSISAEWFAYIVLFPLIMVMLSHRHVVFSVTIAATSWIVFAGYLAVYRNGDLNQVTTSGVVRIIPEFLAGYALYRFVDARGAAQRSDRWLLAGLAIMGVVMVGSPAAVLLVLPAIVLVLFGLYGGGRIADRICGRPLMVFLGEISYSMYMVHTFVQLISNQVLRRLSFEGHAVGIAALAVMILLTVLTAWITHRHLEVPARRWILSRFDRPTASGFVKSPSR